MSLAVSVAIFASFKATSCSSLSALRVSSCRAVNACSKALRFSLSTEKDTSSARSLSLAGSRVEAGRESPPAVLSGVSQRQRKEVHTSFVSLSSLMTVSAVAESLLPSGELLTMIVAVACDTHPEWTQVEALADCQAGIAGEELPLVLEEGFGTLPAQRRCHSWVLFAEQEANHGCVLTRGLWTWLKTGAHHPIWLCLS